jgi:hypothetical protein
VVQAGAIKTAFSQKQGAMRDLKDLIDMAVPDAAGIRERRRHRQDSDQRDASEFEDLDNWWNTEDGGASGPDD